MADSAGDNKSLSEAGQEAEMEKKEETSASGGADTDKTSSEKPEAKSTEKAEPKDDTDEKSKETPMEVEQPTEKDKPETEPEPPQESMEVTQADSPTTEPSTPVSSQEQEEPAEPAPKSEAKDEGPADAKETEPEEPKEKGEVSCYCGKPRKIGSPELLCGICFKFYHCECLRCYVGKVVPFMTNYSFFCKRCNGAPTESFNKKQATFGQMCITAIANLMHKHPGRLIFSKDQEIIPYIDKYWELLTTIPRRIKLTWHTTVLKAMIKEMDTFTFNEDDVLDPKFGLVFGDLDKVGPNYDAMFKAPATVYKGDGKLDAKEMLPLQTKTRGTKRKNPELQQNIYGIKAKKGEVLSTRVAPSGYPSEHPHNKDGYRYILAEPDPHAPNRDAFDSSIEWAGKPIPGYLYRTWLEQSTLLSLHDRAPQLKISDDRMTLVSGEKGYCMMRATHGVGRGAWYFEVTIAGMPQDTATRIGWSQHLGNLQAPCGYDKFSYSWRSRKGTAFHQSRGKHYAEEGYGERDVLGFYIYLPEPEDKGTLLPKTSKDKPLVKFKSHLYFEEKDYVADVEKSLKPAPGSKMVMYKNGVCQGLAYEDVFEGTYYPAVSVYKTASVAMNFGPDFKHPPKDQGEYRPFCQAAQEAMIEHALADILYHVEHEGQFPEF